MALSPETQALLNQWAALCDTDTAGTAAPALTAGSDSNGVGYNVGDLVVTFPDGTRACIPAKLEPTEDTFGTVVLASEAGVDEAGTAYDVGAQIIVFPDSTIACIPPKITFEDTDTFGTVAPATEEGVDSGGNPYVIGSLVATFPDDTTACIAKDTDTFATIDPAPADGTDDFGNDFLAGATILTLADGRIVCIPPKSDPSIDTFGTSAAAINAGSDSYGNGFNVGDIVITLADGTRVCIPPKVTDTDTFGTVAEATEAGVDSFGNAYDIGAEVITFADGSTLCSAKSVPEQELYKAGDTLPDDMVGTIEIVLNDGNTVVLSAGDLVPANSASSVIVDEVTGAPECISKSIVDQDLFKAGDTLPADMVGTIDILLDDGTFATLAAGDPIPANSASDVYVDESTGEASCISKSAPPEAELYEPGDTLPADMAAPIDIVLDDGSIITLNAGEVVPANSASDVFVDEVTGKAACISKYTPDQDLFNPGDTLPADMVGTVDVILEDGTPVTLAAGDVVPATSTGAVYVDEVTGAPRCIGAKLTKEQLVAEFIPGTCEDAALATPQLLASDCKTYDACLLNPPSIPVSCTAAPESYTGPLVKGNVEKTLRENLLEKGQVGVMYLNFPSNIQYYPAPMGVSQDVPLTLDVPAHNPDCILVLHMTYGSDGVGGGTDPTFFTKGEIAGQTGELPTAKEVCFQDKIGIAQTGEHGVHNQVFMWDNSTGSAGSTVTVDFPGSVLDDVTGAIMWKWTELCDEGGSKCTCDDLDLANAQEAVTNYDTVDPATWQTTNEIQSTELSFADCDAVVYSGARHAKHENQTVNNSLFDPDNPGQVETCYPGGWFEPNTTGYIETGQWVSTAWAVCQLGIASGVVTAGTGTFDYTHFGNKVGPYNLQSSGSKACFIPTACAPALPSNQFMETAPCDVVAKNLSCTKDGITECCLTGNMEICVAAGDKVLVVPVINGAECVNQAFGCDNTAAGSDDPALVGQEKKVIEQFNIKKLDSTTVPKNCGEVTHSAFFRIYVETTGLSTSSTVNVGEWNHTCEVKV